MTKLLLLLAFVVLVIAYLRQSRAPVRRPPAERAAKTMVRCAHCGVNQPLSESLRVHGRYYCCEAHRRQAEAAE